MTRMAGRTALTVFLFCASIVLVPAPVSAGDTNELDLCFAFPEEPICQFICEISLGQAPWCLCAEFPTSESCAFICFITGGIPPWCDIKGGPTDTPSPTPTTSAQVPYFPTAFAIGAALALSGAGVALILRKKKS